MSGLTLAEMLIALALVSAVALGATQLIRYVSDRLFVSTEKNVSEEGLLLASHALRLYLSQAVDIEVTTVPIPTNGPAVATGQIHHGYDSAASPSDGGADLIAIFSREWGPTGSPMGSEFRSTAIFFERPNTTGNRWGRLFIDGGRAQTAWDPATLTLSVLPTAADPNLSPTLDDVVIQRLVRVRVQATAGPDPDGAGPLRSKARFASITLTSRYFDTVSRDSWRWCPAPQLVPGNGPCGIRAAFQDVETTLNIGFRNNILVPASFTGAPRPERLYGAVYFFRPDTVTSSP